MDYRRCYQPGGCYFFTVVTHNRQPILTQPDNIARLRRVFRLVRESRPFHIDAIVILPDHLHTVWRLPEDDADFSTRWRMIKHDFSIAIKADAINHSQQRKGEKSIWQRRYWEHTLRDETDWRRHIDYIHYNPVRHGYVTTPSAWPYSSFKQAAAKGWYAAGWGRQEPQTIRTMDRE
jgi:putative transposase